jgi:hypothetical protein
LDDIIRGRYRWWLSVSDNFYQDSFLSSAIELAVEDLLPGTEIQFSARNRHDDLAPHNLAFQMRVSIVFAGAIVPISAGGLMGRDFLQPNLIIVMEPTLIVINENGRRDVHGVNQAKTFADTALANEFFNLWGDVDESAPRRNFKPKMLGKRFQFVCL